LSVARFPDPPARPPASTNIDAAAAGTYLRRRREHNHLTPREVAMIYAANAANVTAAELLIADFEAGKAIASDDALARIRAAYRFDPHVYRQLADGLPAPAICRGCACSFFDPCPEDDGRSACAWAEEDLCTACVTAPPPVPAAEPAPVALQSVTSEASDLAVGQQVRAFSKRWTPDGWEPVEELAIVLDPCVQNDPDYAGDVEIKIEGVLNRTFVPRASLVALPVERAA
jgi:hypothetical protein